VCNDSKLTVRDPRMLLVLLAALNATFGLPVMRILDAAGTAAAAGHVAVA
jgi:hypothetical protein